MHRQSRHKSRCRWRRNSPEACGGACASCRLHSRSDRSSSFSTHAQGTDGLITNHQLTSEWAGMFLYAKNIITFQIKV